jgi:hypothetical protein
MTERHSHVREAALEEQCSGDQDLCSTFTGSVASPQSPSAQPLPPALARRQDGPGLTRRVSHSAACLAAIAAGRDHPAQTSCGLDNALEVAAMEQTEADYSDPSVQVLFCPATASMPSIATDV